VPDNIGLLYHKHLAMFGPREMLLVLGGAGRAPVPQRPDGRPDRHVRRRRTPTSSRPRRTRSCRPLPPIPLSSSPQRHPAAAASASRAPGAATTASTRRPARSSQHVHDVGRLIGCLHDRERVPRADRYRRQALRLRLDVGRALFKRPFQTRSSSSRRGSSPRSRSSRPRWSLSPFGAVIALQVVA
jgi:hypothetical protein